MYLQFRYELHAASSHCHAVHKQTKAIITYDGQNSASLIAKCECYPSLSTCLVILIQCGPLCTLRYVALLLNMNFGKSQIKEPYRIEVRRISVLVLAGNACLIPVTT